MNRSINDVHKILTLQGSLNDIIFLEHFYLISTLKSYLLTKNGDKMFLDFMKRYTCSIEEQILILYYFVEKENAFCLYFKEPLKTIENLLFLLEKKILNQNPLLKKEILEMKTTIKRYPLLFQKEKQNESLYETMEMDSRGILLDHPRKALKDCFILDAVVYQVLIRKHPIDELKLFLEDETIYYVLGSIHKLLFNLKGSVSSIEDCTYCLQDFTYLNDIIPKFFSYANDSISKSIVELITVLLEDDMEDNIEKEEKGKVLLFKRK